MSKRTATKWKGSAKYQVDRIRSKVAKDIPRFIRKELRIVDGRAKGAPKLIPFTPNWSQEQVLKEIDEQHSAGKPVRLIIVKSRQVGISTLCSAYVFAQTWANDFTASLVMAHKDDVTKNMFDMHKRYNSYLDSSLVIPTDRDNVQEIDWTTATGSSIKIATAGSKDSTRSRTLRHVHGSECAFYKNMTGLKGAIEAAVANEVGTTMIWESTAYGAGGDFHAAWQAAADGHYKQVFLEWFKDPNCSMPPFPDDKTQDAYLEMIFDKYPQLEDRMNHFKLKPEQLAWYHYILHNDYSGDMLTMACEYPMTVAEAFRATGAPVFPLDLMDNYRDKQIPGRRYDPMTTFNGLSDAKPGKYLKPNYDAYMEIWIPPQPGRHYLISLDPAAGLVGSDFSCAYIFDIASQNICGVVHGLIAIKPFAKIAKTLGRIYNDAVLMPEVDGMGAALLEEIIEDYFHVYQRRKDDGFALKLTQSLGWETNRKTKYLIAGNGRQLLAERIKEAKEFLPDKWLYEELCSFTQDDLDGNGKGILDRAMAWLIGLQGCMHELKSRPEIASTIQSSKTSKGDELKVKPADVLAMVQDPKYVPGKPYEIEDKLSGPFVPTDLELEED